ncbi:hypothetical protein DRQ26_02335 [bacterium]|nr:MAG: hypothetical protein DRQ26_02335 [bacterium]
MSKSNRAEKFERLKHLLEQTGLHYFADGDKEVCLVRFSDLEHTDYDTVFITLQGSADDIIVATLTILDGDKGYHYSTEVLEECMKFNKNVGLLKAQYDERYGDIDVSYETWLATLPENFNTGIQLLAGKGNDLARVLKSMMKI